MKFNKKHIGSSFESWLEEEGILEESTNFAVKNVLAWQLAQEMKKKKLTKQQMAASMKTSRAQLDRFFQDTAAEVPQPEVHLRPNRLAKYDAVARTLADAQRLGVTKIGFVGNEQYVE